MRVQLKESEEKTAQFQELIDKINSVYGFKYIPKPSNNLQGYFKISNTTRTRLNCEFNEDLTLKSATLVLPTNMINIMNEDSFEDVDSCIQSTSVLVDFIKDYVSRR